MPDTTHPTRRLLTEKEKCAQLGLSPSYLQHDRCREKPNIPFVRFGRVVRYTEEAGLPTPPAEG